MSGIHCASLRIVRLLVDAGTDTESAGQARGDVIFDETPLGLASHCLREKEIGPGEIQATRTQLHTAIRRLLLLIDAVHAVSWLWSSDASSTTHPVQADGSSRTTTASTTLTAMLPTVRRRGRRPRVLLASLFRWAQWRGVDPSVMIRSLLCLM